MICAISYRISPNDSSMNGHAIELRSLELCRRGGSFKTLDVAQGADCLGFLPSLSMRCMGNRDTTIGLRWLFHVGLCVLVSHLGHHHGCQLGSLTVGCVHSFTSRQYATTQADTTRVTYASSICFYFSRQFAPIRSQHDRNSGLRRSGWSRYACSQGEFFCLSN